MSGTKKIKKKEKQRGKGRGSMAQQNMERVQSTNSDSIVSKRSAARGGYFKDEFLRFFVDKPSNRSPLINRGYYIRCVAVRQHLSDFLRRHGSEGGQIVSLGAGFDTSFFVMAEAKEMRNAKYFEVDFGGVVQHKAEVVQGSQELAQMIKNVQRVPTGLKGDNYCLIEADLKKTEELQAKLVLHGLNVDKPILFLAEVVMTYMAGESSSALIGWAGTFPLSEYVTYEQILPHDAFGQMMCSNLVTRGSPLLGINSFPTLETQRARYIDSGFKHVQIMDLNQFWNSIPREESSRVVHKEPFDEEEEWKLKCAHYFILHAYKAVTEAVNLAEPVAVEKEDELVDGQVAKWSTSLVAKGKVGGAGRWAHSACSIGNTVVVFGGYGGHPHNRLNDVYSFNLTTLEWSEPLVTGISPLKRMFHTATMVGSNMFVFGGRDSPQKSFNDLHILDTVSMRWSQVFPQDQQSMPPPRWRHTAALVHDKIYIFGGRNSTSVLDDMWSYDILTSEWKLIPPSGHAPQARYSHSAQTVGDCILVYGGVVDSFTILGDLFEFNTKTSIWRKVETSGACPSPRFSHCCVMNGQKMYVIGGCSAPTFDELYVLDTEQYMWKRLRAEPSTTSQASLLVKHACVYHDNKIFALGGGALCFSFGSLFSPMNVLLLDGQEPEPQVHMQQEAVAQFKENVEPAKIPKPKKSRKHKEIKRIDNPSAETFLNAIYPQRRPVIITNANFGTACSSWTSTYLKDQCQNKQVSVHVSKHSRMDFINKNFDFKNMDFADLISKVEEEKCEEKYYLRSVGLDVRKQASDIYESFPELAKDFKIPEFVPMAQRTSTSYFSSAFRVSSKDMQMWTHYDVMDNILCEIKGKKRVVFWPPNEVGNLYVSGSTSRVLDIDNPDFRKFPKFPKSRAIECLLEPGEILFIPALWFHNVWAIEPCISINVFWRHLGPEFYEKKDLYGNRDLVLATKAAKEAETICQTLSQIPEYYREFYARRIINILESTYS